MTASDGRRSGSGRRNNRATAECHLACIDSLNAERSLGSRRDGPSRVVDLASRPRCSQAYIIETSHSAQHCDVGVRQIQRRAGFGGRSSHVARGRGPVWRPERQR